MIRKEINELIKGSMKSREKDRLYVLKMIKAEFSKFETSKGFKESDFTDAKEISILQKMHKAWKEEYDALKQAGRDYTESENRLHILESMLPETVSENKIREAILSSGESVEMKNMGKILKYVQGIYPTVTGKEVSAILKSMI